MIETIAGRGYRFVATVEDQAPNPLEFVTRPGTSATETNIEEQEIKMTGDSSADLPVGMRETTPPIAALASSSIADSPTVARWSGWNRPLDGMIGLLTAGRFSVGAAVLVGLALYSATQTSHSDQLGISAYKQITTDGRPKAIGGTDGSRIYFTQIGNRSTAEVSISGGVVAPVQLALKDAWSGDVSPDGSTLLINSQAGGQGPANSLWSFQLIGGSFTTLQMRQSHLPGP